MPHAPAYDAYRNQPRPLIHWETSRGSWVGIWGYDWPDQLGAEMRKLQPSLEYQVWQPDLRADRVYQQTLEGGVLHRLFPASSQKRWWGGGDRIFSVQMMTELEALLGEPNTILHLNYMRDVLCNSILDRKMGIPTLLEFHGTISLPLDELWDPSWNFPRKLELLREGAKLSERLQQVHLVVSKNSENLDALRASFSGQIRQITMGVDFDFWSKRKKSKARSQLHLPQAAFIFLSVGRLIDLKQVDRFIQVLNQINPNREVVFVVVGNGESTYLELLQRLAVDPPKGISYCFPGYMRGSELLDWYSSADVFVSVSLSEGASVACMEALACELPILSTDVGAIAELLQSHDRGLVVGKTDYGEWEVAITNILNGKKSIVPLSRSVARSEYHWPKVAARMLTAYQTALEISLQKVHNIESARAL